MTAEQDGPECLSDRESGREGRVRAGERFKETESNSQSTWLGEGGGGEEQGAGSRVQEVGELPGGRRLVTAGPTEQVGTVLPTPLSAGCRAGS